MRVAYLCADPGVPIWGGKGCSLHVQAVLRVLVRRGARVHVYCARTGGSPPADLVRVQVSELRVDRDAPCREKALQVLARQMQQMVHAAGPHDLVLERYSLWSRAAADRRGDPSPTVLEVNAPLVDEQARHRALVDHAEALAVARSALSSGPVVCVSASAARWAVQHGAHPAQVAVIPNGVDIDRFRPGPARRGEPYTVGFIGSLRPWHGTPVLLEAFAEVSRADPTSRLVVVGDGPQRQVLAERVTTLGLGDRVHLTGAVPPGHVARVLHQLDVAVAPYDDPGQDYFSPLKVFEYLAAGVPVVASDVGQVPDLLGAHAGSETSAAGLVVPPGDHPALAEALLRLRYAPVLRQQLGRRGRQLAVALHHWEGIVDRVVAHAGPPTLVGAA